LGLFEKTERPNPANTGAISSSHVGSPSKRRRQSSLNERPFDTTNLHELAHPKSSKEKTVLYLAYGSNLSAETFLGKRGIRPLSQVNVVVPSLKLTFDLPGVPYKEPCFANTRYITPSDPRHDATSSPRSYDYHKDRWQKGLVGVVYEVTLPDYAHIIATEGGGSGYQDIVIDCYELPSSTSTVPLHPSSAPFKAHTLFAPATDGAGQPGRLSRPDPAYAQPSGRYLKLITDGAREHGLPLEYREYLAQIRPYTMTSARQRIGGVTFLAFWAPFIMFLFGISRLVADKDGRVPKWVIPISEAIFGGMWWTYDRVYKGMFGDGERTQGQDEEEVVRAPRRSSTRDEKEPLL
jgi:hypothetical protein